MFSSASVEWQTPRYLFDYLNKKFNFDLDPCASPDNALCENFFTKVENGLEQSWGGKKVFMNPPYGKNIIGKWVKKAYMESQLNNAVVVCLLPARTDTDWFWEYCRYGQIFFLNKRVQFQGNKSSGSTFPSMIVVFQNFQTAANDQNKEFWEKMFNGTIFTLDHLSTGRPNTKSKKRGKQL